jgi:nuclear pore complex protein Nup93
MESTDLIPLDGDVAKITRKAEEFKDLHDALQRNLQVYLPLTMDALAAIHQSIKNSAAAQATRQMVCTRVSHCFCIISRCFLSRH